jgi:hypothetical protein
MKTEEITRFDRLVQQDSICQAILTELGVILKTFNYK